MKTYKSIILAVWLCLSVIPLLAMVGAYSDGYLVVLLLLAGVGLWFNWKYAEGEWPEMSYWKACCIALGLAAVGLYISLTCMAEQYQRSVGVIAEMLLDYSPQVYFQPLIITPISLLIWRWLFKEPRTARLVEASMPTVVESA